MKSALPASGLVTKSVSADARWMKTEGWCALCNEPCSSWIEHISSRHLRHRSIEMMYDHLVHYEQRTWDPRQVMYSSVVKFGLLWSDLSKEFPAKVYPLTDHQEAQCRHRLYRVIEALQKEGILVNMAQRLETLGSQQLIKGSQIAPCMVMKALIGVFPNYDCGYLSDILQCICDIYNYDETFRFLNYYHLFPDLYSPASAVDTEPNPDAEEAEGLASQTESSIFFTKAIARKEDPHHRPHYVFKTMLGELYYVYNNPTAVRKHSVHVQQLARYALHALVAELMICRLSEFSLLADRAWRQDFEYAVNNPTLSRTKSPINARASHATAMASTSTLLNVTLGDYFLNYSSKWSIHRHTKTQARLENAEDKEAQKKKVSEAVGDVLSEFKSLEESCGTKRFLTSPINTHKLRFSAFFHRQV